jgi:hypothetical protein
MVLRRFVWLLFVTNSSLGGGTFAEDARPGETQITANVPGRYATKVREVIQQCSPRWLRALYRKSHPSGAF